MALAGLDGLSLEDPTKVFEVTEKLGEGAYASVFKAIDLRDGSVVAVKIIEIEPDENFEGLKREINILKDCQSEFIVAYKGAFQSDGRLWIVMEYCDAGSLLDLMSICHKTLTETEIAATMNQALQGLKYLHNSRRIHRDIKSGNLLLTHKGECKLADFGVSTELTNTVAKRKTMIGTPYWMAPEVLKSTDYDGKADIWSLAITAIELALGVPPHSNVHPMRAIFLIPTQPSPTLPNPEKWSPAFHEFLRICLAKDPAARPTAEQLLSSCSFVADSQPQSLIADLVRKSMEQIERFRREGGSDKEDGDEGDEESDTDTPVATMKPAKTLTKAAPPVDSGTLVLGPAGTLKYSAPRKVTTVINPAPAPAASPAVSPPPLPRVPTTPTASNNPTFKPTCPPTPPPRASMSMSFTCPPTPPPRASVSLAFPPTPPPRVSMSFSPIPPATPPPRLSIANAAEGKRPPFPPAGPPPRRGPAPPSAAPPMVHMGVVRTKNARQMDPQARADEIQMLLDSITIISTEPPSEEREETLEELGKKLAAMQFRPIVGLPPPPPKPLPRNARAKKSVDAL